MRRGQGGDYLVARMEERGFGAGIVGDGSEEGDVSERNGDGEPEVWWPDPTFCGHGLGLVEVGDVRRADGEGRMG